MWKAFELPQMRIRWCSYPLHIRYPGTDSFGLPVEKEDDR